MEEEEEEDKENKRGREQLQVLKKNQGLQKIWHTWNYENQ